ncbi:hypothetical protein [Thalassoglobus sp.]|uniref:hypothetical protein n=1 Tax=Thalassoglobus sp. TaxID=2795869 RepID=UPI003AA7C663
MSEHSPSDFVDPLRRAYRRLLRVCRNLLIVVLATVVIVLIWGIPAFQNDYRYYETGKTPTAMDKINADYWIPGFGWRVVVAGRYAPGCPYIVFVPLRDCFKAE